MSQFGLFAVAAFLATLSTRRVDCEPTGAPESVCESMEPFHGPSPQPIDTSPYRVTTTAQDGYIPRDEYNITIEQTSGSGKAFKGFLCQVRPQDKSYSTQGTFVVSSNDPKAKTIYCPVGSGVQEEAAVTHKNRGVVSSQTVRWTAPDAGKGNLTAVCTVVLKYDTFWVQISSAPFVELPLPNISCNATFCYRNPPNCKPSTCDYSVIINTDRDRGQTTISLATVQSGMIALGFSSDTLMGEDDVVGCYRTSNGSVVVVDAWNPSGHDPNILDTLNNLNMSESSGSYVNGVLECTIVRRLTTEDADHDYDWTQDWYLLYAYSSNTGPSPNGFLPIHTVKPTTSDDRVIIDPLPPTNATTTSTTTPNSDCSDTSTCVPTTNSDTPTTPLSSCQTGDIDFSDGNGFIYHAPSGCTSRTCEYGLKIVIKDAQATIQLTTIHDGMIALGFSDDKNMGEDDVVGCVRTGDSTVVAMDAWNPNGQNANVPDSINNLDQARSCGTFTNGRIQCQIVRDLVSTDSVQDYDWREDWFLLFAYSTSTGSSGGGFPFHSNIPLTTAEKVNISRNGSVDAESSDLSRYIKAHGILMIIAWIGLASTGMLLARYYKHVYPNEEPSCCFSGTPAVWFQLHRMHMVTTVILSIAGFIVIFVGVEGWTADAGDSIRKSHPIIGTICVALALAQPIMAIFRCGPRDSKRPIFNWAHFLVGSSALILGIVNVFLGTRLAIKSPLSTNNIPFYTVIGWTATALCIWLIFDLKACLDKSATGDDGFDMEMHKVGQRPVIVSQEPSEDALSKQIILVIYMVMSVGAATVMSVFIGIA
ncbi:ferric-chelate reductase 1-like isoform X2 [Oscarella lobularis]